LTKPSKPGNGPETQTRLFNPEISNKMKYFSKAELLKIANNVKKIKAEQPPLPPPIKTQKNTNNIKKYFQDTEKGQYRVDRLREAMGALTTSVTGNSSGKQKLLFRKNITEKMRKFTSAELLKIANNADNERAQTPIKPVNKTVSRILQNESNTEEQPPLQPPRPPKSNPITITNISNQESFYSQPNPGYNTTQPTPPPLPPKINQDKLKNIARYQYLKEQNLTNAHKKKIELSTLRQKLFRTGDLIRKETTSNTGEVTFKYVFSK